jgi:hypothetical protein
MSDDEAQVVAVEKHRRSADDDDDERNNRSMEDITGKKLKKKKKSSSKSKGEKSSSSSLSAGSDGLAAPAIVGRIVQYGKDATWKVKESTFAAANLSNTSSKAMMTRVLILVVFALVVIGIGHTFFAGAEVQQVAPVAQIEPEEIIIQKPGKKIPKVNLSMEKDFGCREIMCVAQCNGKAKPKCLKSRSCVSERDKICLKRCRKSRCEERCKDEPHLGYVEREQGLEKCKDACTGPTASHNKCVVKCHVKFKPCKSRCFDTASKYKCDNPKTLAMVSQQAPGSGGSSSSSSSGGGDDEEEEEGNESRGSDDAEDDEDGGAAPPPPSKKKSSSIPGLDDDDLL